MPGIFINCPFDNEYFPLMRAMLFTVKYTGFEPLIAQTTDSGQVRIKKIIRMMQDAEYSIHDISRIEAINEGDLPRFNMPFECGIDFGIKYCEPYTHKKFLILEKERHRYQKVLSDISGNDIFSHDNEAEKLVKQLRNWLWHHNDKVASFKAIWDSYQIFDATFVTTMENEGLDPHNIYELPFAEIMQMMEEFITA